MTIRMAGSIARNDSLRLYHRVLTSNESFDLQDIPPSHDDIRITCVLRAEAAAVVVSTYLFFNNDQVNTNYRHAFQSGGTDSADGVSELPIYITTPGNTAVADYFAIYKIWIPDYASDKAKIAYAYQGFRSTATVINTAWFFGHWENTAPLTRIQIQADNADVTYAAGSRMSLWLER